MPRRSGTRTSGSVRCRRGPAARGGTENPSLRTSSQDCAACCEPHYSLDCCVRPIACRRSPARNRDRMAGDRGGRTRAIRESRRSTIDRVRMVNVSQKVCADGVLRRFTTATVRPDQTSSVCGGVFGPLHPRNSAESRRDMMNALTMSLQTCRHCSAYKPQRVVRDQPSAAFPRPAATPVARRACNRLDVGARRHGGRLFAGRSAGDGRFPIGSKAVSTSS